MRLGRIAACLAATVLAATESPAASDPRVTVAESAGIARRAHPVTIGVPLPRGWLPAGAPARVASTAGALPTQAEVLSQWPDRSARWLLLDFQADLTARASTGFEVQKGTPPAAKVKVAVKKVGTGVEIDAGALRLVAGRESGGLFRLDRLDGEAFEAGPLRAEVVAGGQPAAAGSPEEIEILDQGPLRAAVTLRGRYANGLAYELRLEAFAGRPIVRLLHTLINTRPEAETAIESLAVLWPQKLTGETSYAASLRGGEALSGKLGESGVVLEQLRESLLRRGDEARAGRLDGWFTVTEATRALGLEVPFFWQEFPQAVRLSASGLRYEMRSAGDGPMRFGVGAAKTHEFYLVFGKSGELAVEPGRGVTAAADPTWTAASGALPNAVDPRREAAFVGEVSRGFDRVMASVDEEPWDEAGACAGGEGRQEVRRRGFYGTLNWGDWNFRRYHDTTKGCDAWGNQEYDLTQVLGLLFAATERPEVWEYFEAAARHFADVDTIHFLPRHPEWVGMNHPKNPWHFTFELGGVDLGHTWVEGLFTHHFLSGDPRSRAAAVGIADYLARRLRSTLRGNPRQFGWPALALAAAFEATGSELYRSAALQYAKLGIAAHPVPEKIAKNWKLGILADGVSYAHAVTGDAGLRAWLERYAAAVVRSKPKDIRYYPAVAYVARLTGDDAMKEAARATAGRIVLGDWGKPFTIGARTGFRILSLLDAKQ